MEPAEDRLDGQAPNAFGTTNYWPQWSPADNVIAPYTHVFALLPQWSQPGIGRVTRA